MSRARILNGAFDPLTLEGTLDRVFGLIERGERGYLCTVNVAILMMMRDSPRLQGFVDRAMLVVADGMPLVWASKRRGTVLPERVTGVDLVEKLCAGAATRGLGVYLLGATPDVIQESADRLRSRFPGLEISGVADGHYPAAEAPLRARAIRDSGARILIVGMGVPRQEHFIEDHWESLGVSFALGVGGSFEVLAGRKTRAPVALQKLGLEWAFRLTQEPRRLFKRYMVTNTRFLALLTRETLLGR